MFLCMLEGAPAINRCRMGILLLCIFGFHDFPALLLQNIAWYKFLTNHRSMYLAALPCSMIV
jgi:hypothetical protein